MRAPAFRLAIASATLLLLLGLVAYRERIRDAFIYWRHDGICVESTGLSYLQRTRPAWFFNARVDPNSLDRNPFLPQFISIPPRRHLEAYLSAHVYGEGGFEDEPVVQDLTICECGRILYWKEFSESAMFDRYVGHLVYAGTAADSTPYCGGRTNVMRYGTAPVLRGCRCLAGELLYRDFDRIVPIAALAPERVFASIAEGTGMQKVPLDDVVGLHAVQP